MMRKHILVRWGLPIFLILLLWAVCAAVGYASSEDAVWPESPGTVVDSNGNMTVDSSHADQGYVMIRVTNPTKNRMKLRVTYGGGQLMYDVNSEGEFEAFPLQLGSGKYEFSMFENVKGSKYSAAGKVTLTVELVDPNAAYLVPNQYVNYNILTEAVKKSDEIGSGATRGTYDAVCNFISSEFAYDFVRAATISPGELPDIDYCYENRMGICQDLSAVMVCMLRVQGIPARLVIGYADKYYHAWTVTVLDGEEIFFDPTVAVGALNVSKYAIERMY